MTSTPVPRGAAVSPTPRGSGAERPARPVGAGFVALYALASFGALLVLLTPSLESLALRIDVLVPAEEAPGVLGLVLTIGLVLQVVALPLAGRMSDRTRSRFGRRRPWIAGGAIGLLAGGATMAAVPGVGGLIAGFAIVSIAGSACVAALLALLSDRVPASQRASVSAVLGLGTVAALVAGSIVVAALPHNSDAMFLLPAAIGAFFILLFAVMLREPGSSGTARAPSTGWQSILSAFWVDPRRHPDFAWAYASRFLMQLAYAFLTTYQAFYLISHLGIAPVDVAGRVLVGTLLLAAATVVSSLVAGRLSDKLHRRKVFVISAAFVTVGALLVIAAAGSLEMFYAGLVLGGVGYGAYTAVDLALAADVLPDPEDAANDMAIFNTASTLPQALAPAIAPLILVAAAQSYPVLYAVAAGIAVVGGLVIFLVRGIR